MLELEQTEEVEEAFLEVEATKATSTVIESYP
jgi:hypothetical protein